MTAPYNAAGPYGPAGGLQQHPKAQTVFYLGIAGIFVGILAFVAWYMGGQAMKEVAANPGVYTAEGNLKTGYMLGKIFSIIYIVLTVLYIVIMIFVVVAAMQGN